MSSPSQRFRKMCLEVLDKDGRRTNNGTVWSLDTKTMAIIYDSGYLVVQDKINRSTVWDDRLGGPCTALVPYYEILERLLVLERLADV